LFSAVRYVLQVVVLGTRTLEVVVTFLNGMQFIRDLPATLAERVSPSRAHEALFLGVPATRIQVRLVVIIGQCTIIQSHHLSIEIRHSLLLFLSVPLIMAPCPLRAHGCPPSCRTVVYLVTVFVHYPSVGNRALLFIRQH